MKENAFEIGELEIAATNMDWGSDTFSRFRYQAEVTLPYCLSAIRSENDILAVIPEHVEDIAIKTSFGWRFIQVKSRDPERGLWRLNDLFEKSGALRSLYRTYLLTTDMDYPLEVVLEGTIKPKDPIGYLRPNEEREDLVPVVMQKLDADETSARDFLRRVVLDEGLPPRSVIQATNARLLHECLPELNKSELDAVYESLLSEIEKAMGCERFGAFWPNYVLASTHRPTKVEENLRRKTLDKERLSAVTKTSAPSNRPLLKRMVELGRRPTSSLTQKLILGGATSELITRARNLRANAQYHRYVRSAQGISSQDSQLSDLHERLLVHADTAASVCVDFERPAIKMWEYLLHEYSTHGEKIDRSNLVSADPMLLLGESCVLSDQCEFNWGTASVGSE